MFKWPPPKGRISTAVVVPSSNLALYKDLRLKTRLAGEYARALTVFRVPTLAIFRDPDATEEDHCLFLKVSKYMLIPPYLRVKAESLDRDLRFAGFLPPLTVYPHNPENRHVSAGDFRFGLVLNEYGLIDIGWKRPCRLSGVKPVKPGEIKLIRVESTDPLICHEVSDPPIYAGYKVVDLADGGKLKDFLKGYDLVINTSKTGKYIHHILGDREATSKINSARSLCLLFGNPKKDFDELVGESIRVDLTINFIPNQGALTVRTYEALVSSLAILNVILEMR